MKSVISILIVLPVLLSSSVAFADPELNNLVVDVIDGDTLRISGSKEKIRLLGIDACEVSQKAKTSTGQVIDCGEPATTELTRLTARQKLSCRVTGRDRYKRLLARCGTPGTPDLGAELVKQGLAVVYRYKNKPTVPEYVLIEDRARTSKLGLWSLDFEEPFLHRRRK
jgi:endonuclease YncB( thermonuclease family)